MCAERQEEVGLSKTTIAVWTEIAQILPRTSLVARLLQQLAPSAALRLFTILKVARRQLKRMPIRAVPVPLNEDHLFVVSNHKEGRVWAAFDPQEPVYLASAR